MPFPPSKKSGMSVMLGIAPKGPREEPPPAYSGAKAPPPDPDAAMEGAEGGEGMCSVMCPKCGEALQLQVMPVPDAAPEESEETMPDMEAAG